MDKLENGPILLDNFLTKKGNLRGSPSSNMLLYTTLIFLRDNPGKIPKFIDFGGACGENIILLSVTHIQIGSNTCFNIFYMEKSSLRKVKKNSSEIYVNVNRKF